MTADLILGAVFLAIAIIAASAGWIGRLRNIERAQHELAARSYGSWLDPKMLAVGLEMGRTLGWRRLITLAAAGLFAAGAAREWYAARAKSENREAED